MGTTKIDGRQVADGGLTDADIATANKDGIAATASMRTLGTGAQQACAGNDSRLSDARTPVGTSLAAAKIWVGSGGNAAAAVTMSGDATLDNAGALTIANLAVTAAKVAAANKDGLAAAPSMRTLGTGAQQAAAGNHTHVIADVTDLRPISAMLYTFDSTVGGTPASGAVTFNNATYSSATAVRINVTDVLGKDFTNTIAAFSLSGSTGGSFASPYGLLKFYSKADPSKFVIFKLFNVTPNLPYYILTVTYFGGSGTLTTTAGDLGCEFNYTLVIQTDSSNRLINGDGQIWQRQTPGTDASRADGTYAADRWYVLTQSNPINVKRTAGEYNGFAHRLTQSNASAQRMGYAQIIEYQDTLSLVSQYLAFQGRINISNSQPVRFAILAWTGTADVPTKDVVNSWTNSTYTAGNFFISSNFSVQAVGTITPAANTWTDFELITGSPVIGSNNNYYVFIWTEGTAAQNVTLDLARLQLVPALDSSLRIWCPRPYQQELALCQRFYEKSFFVDTAPADNTAGAVSVIGYANATNEVQYPYRFAVQKRAVPTITQYRSAGAGSTNGIYAVLTGGSFVSFTSINATPATALEWGIDNLRAASFTAGNSYLLNGHWTAEAEIGV